MFGQTLNEASLACPNARSLYLEQVLTKNSFLLLKPIGLSILSKYPCRRQAATVIFRLCFLINRKIVQTVFARVCVRFIYRSGCMVFGAVI